MKLTNYLFVLALGAVLFTSCGKDDEDDILGKWVLTELDASGCADDMFSDAIFSSTDEGLCFMEDGAGVCLDLCITFRADGTVDLATSFVITGLGLDFSDSLTETGTWTQTGNQIEICDEDGDCQIVDRSSSGSINFSEYEEDLDCTVSWTLEKE